MQEVRRVHHILMTPVWTVEPHPDATDYEGPGSFRRHEIADFSAGMSPPAWTEVDSRVRAWVDAASGLRRRAGELCLPAELARLHSEFGQIHPFLDGDGRAGRLLLNLLLGRLGYPPAIVHKRDRERYLKALQRADRGSPARSPR